MLYIHVFTDLFSRLSYYGSTRELHRCMSKPCELPYNASPYRDEKVHPPRDYWLNWTDAFHKLQSVLSCTCIHICESAPPLRLLPRLWTQQMHFINCQSSLSCTCIRSCVKVHPSRDKHHTTAAPLVEAKLDAMIILNPGPQWRAFSAYPEP